MNSLHKAACEEIDASAAELHDLSQEIWNHPEENFQEIFAHGLLTNFLEKRGLHVDRNFVINTGFRSVTGSSENGPHVAVLCEYDALPEIGHACGHNLIAEAGIAAGLGIIAAFKTNGKALGKLSILGTPAEEGGGGKITMIDANFFCDVDVALMAHPSPVNRYAYNSLAIERVIVKFVGKASHASMFPWDGVNALDAAVLCYQNVSCMRQQLKPSWRVHGIIKHGGVKANIIPEFTELVFYARTPTKEELQVLMTKLEQCFHSAASATGCTVKISTAGTPYLNHINNKVLSDLYFDNARAVGIDFDKYGVKPGQTVPAGSTDMGNVSHVVPSIHPTFYIGTDVASHTRAFALAAGDPNAQKYTLSVGKAMAMTAIDVFTKPKLLQKIKQDFDMNH